MSKPITIRVSNFTGGPLAISAADGQIVHDHIVPLLRAGKPMALSFVGIETIIAAFLGAAVGQLYGELVYGDVDSLLSVRDLNADDRAMLDRVIRNAKMYYANPAAYDAAWREECDVRKAEVILDPNPPQVDVVGLG